MNSLHGQRPCDRAIGTGPVRANPAATHRLRHLEPVRPPVSPIFAARRRQERSETADAITCIYPAPPPGAEQRRPAPQRPRPAEHTPAVPDPICPAPASSPPRHAAPLQGEQATNGIRRCLEQTTDAFFSTRFQPLR